MNNIIKFDYLNVRIRSLLIEGQPWFAGRDVATALGYEKPADTVRKHVDDEDKGVSILETPSGAQEMVIVNEAGLYSLIFSSGLPSAKAFKRWVSHEVLPQIRATGRYIAPEVIKDENGIHRFALDGKLYVCLDDIRELRKLKRVKLSYHAEKMEQERQRRESLAEEALKTHPYTYEVAERFLAERHADLEWLIYQMDARKHPEWYFRVGDKQFFSDAFLQEADKAIEWCYEA